MSAGDLMFTDDMMVTDGPAYRAIPEDEFKQIQDQIATLTRQRDLAVEALHHISLCSQNSMSSQRQCGELARAAIKESEEN